METQTCTAIFQDNEDLANEISDNVIQHFVHCIETNGRHVQYLKFLQTVVKTEGNYIRKTQDMVMGEVGCYFGINNIDGVLPYIIVYCVHLYITCTPTFNHKFGGRVLLLHCIRDLRSIHIVRQFSTNI